MSARHAPCEPAPVDAALWPDPELALAWADMKAWHEAHPSLPVIHDGREDEEGDDE